MRSSSDFQSATNYARSYFEISDIAYAVLLQGTMADHIDQTLDIIPVWLRAFVTVGRYEDCVAFTDQVLSSSGWSDIAGTPKGVHILQSRAKALRNLGRFSCAMSCYRQALDIAKIQKDSVLASRTLLMIGKVYGNYLGQRSLFSAFVEKALSNLKSELKTLPANSEQITRCYVHMAICHDALGQAYRGSEPEQAIWHFNSALRYNRMISRIDGLSRATCHMARFKFVNAIDDRQRRLSLSAFSKGIRLLNQLPWEQRGYGVRYVQYAQMLGQIGDETAAQSWLQEGKAVAILHNDFKTCIRAAMVEAQLYKDRDEQRAANALVWARDIARRYGLEVLEAEVNRSLTQFSGYYPNHLPGPHELLLRNRDIVRRLIDQVKESRVKLESRDHLTPEFASLSRSTQHTFRQKLLLDMDHALTQLCEDIGSLTQAFRQSEDRKQALLVSAAVNSQAKALIHEVKIESEDLEEVAARIDDLAGEIGRRLDHGAAATPQSVSLALTSLRKEATRLRRHASKLSDLKRMLRERLQHHLSDKWVNLQEVCKQVWEEFRAEGSYYTLQEDFAANIEVFSSQEMIAPVVRNLIHNSLQAFAAHGIREGCLVITLRTEVSGQNFREATFAIGYLFQDEEQSREAARSIEEGLRREKFSRPDSTGVGLVLARDVFEYLLKARLQAGQRKNYAGVEIVLPLNSLQARLRANKERE